MYTVKLNNVTYTIPLHQLYTDSICNVINRDENSWKREQRNQYREFNYVYAEDFDSDFSTTKCNICNIDVPIKHMKEHSRSTIHKAYMKIADISLNRAREQLSADLSSLSIATTSQYCDMCSEIKMDNHEKTQKHVESLKFNKYINDFVKIYTNEQCIGDIDFTYLTDNEISKVDFKNYVKLLIKMYPNSNVGYGYINDEYIELTTEDLKVKMPVDNFLGINNNNCVICSKDCDNIEKHLYDVEHIEKVARNMDENCFRKINTKTSYCVLCKSLIASTKKTAHLSTELHNANIKETIIIDKKTTKTFCDTCAIYIDNENLETHKTSTTHNALKDYLNCGVSTASENSVKNDSKSIVNVSTDSSDTKLHYHLNATSKVSEVVCKICNVLIPNNTTNITGHTNGKSHNNKYNSLMSTHKINLVDSVCNICNVKIPGKNEIEHINGRNHQSALAKAQAVANQTTLAGQSVKTLVIPAVTSSVTAPTPVNVKAVAKTSVTIQAPITAKTPVAPATSTTSVTVKPLATAKPSVSSPVTSSNLHEKSKFQNTANKTDSKNGANTSTINEGLDQYNNNLTALSNSLLKDMFKTLSSHLSDTVTETVPVTTAVAPKVAQKTYCRTCSIYIDTHNFICHENGTKHRQKVSSENQNFYCEVQKFEERLVKIEEDIYLVPTETNSFVLCRICDVTVPNNTSNKKEHLNGYNHKNMVNKRNKKNESNNDNSHCENNNNMEVDKVATERTENAVSIQQTEAVTDQNSASETDDDLYNDMRQTKNPRQVLCTICNVIVPNIKSDIKNHINGFRHQSMITEDSSDTTDNECVEDEEQYDDEYEDCQDESTDGSSVTEDHYDKYLYLLKNTSNKNEIICRVCNVIMANFANHASRHLNSKKHKLNYEKILSENKICATQNYYICDVCRIIVKFRSEIDHILGKQHLLNLKESS